MELCLPEQIVPLIAGWFRENGRSLPWREGADPYRVWISEIMLQQTRIEAVIPYYHRFLAAFPDAESLARAEDDVLMKLWEGLGYYSRARNLKKAAIVIARDYGGSLPPDRDRLRSLPGIGDYTAGAIASVAFGLPEPAVDGNVLRVVSRLAAYDGDVTQPATKNEVTRAQREIYPAGADAARFTEGLMELGEVVCVPNARPRCEACPVRSICRASIAGTTELYPVRSPKKERRREDVTVLLIRAPDGGILLRRRPSDAGLLAGLWEYPTLPGRLDEAAIRAAVGERLGGAAVTEVRPAGEKKHIFTHIEWRMTGVFVTLGASPSALPDGWAAPQYDELTARYALPTAFRKFSGLLA